MIIDTAFNFYSDSNGGDPDSKSPTLRKYHKILWSKPLPNGAFFELSENKNGAYLYHKSELGEFYLGSDAITHSYKNTKRKKWLTEQMPNEVNELFDTGSTIGAYIIFPNKQIDRKNTINQARGVNSLIDDRFDLTLECIRLFYSGEKSPLYDTLLRYKKFFDLFGDFAGYIHFFLLDDLVDKNFNVKFYLQNDGFSTRPTFADQNQYRLYKDGVIDFIRSRNKRIERYIKKTEKSVATNSDVSNSDRPKVVGLAIAKASGMEMQSVNEVEIPTGHGITGDRYENSRHRHVTVQSLEEIAQAEEKVGRKLSAIRTRRNITIDSGLLNRTPGSRLRIGSDERGWVELEVVRDAAPCKVLTDNFGRDAKLALHKRAGVVYRTIKGGVVRLGDELNHIP